ncbi:hypothetical protein D9613_012356 [Agrocybe pediades]|uniref:Uncharacterized protein n=1 Tax=Agrocybe pediades TaxID=84607 RepID=A0A8H4QRT9_9AGAR|nr:hypothetical protein D9613_012356 [Agrocybe pediades]
MRRLALHASALSDEEYDLYTSSLRDIALADDDEVSRSSGKVNGGNTDDDGYLENMNIGVREARAWLRGRYSHISASIIDSILRLFSPSLAHGDTLYGEEFFAVLRLVIHAESGKPVDRSLAFVQASPSKPSNAQASTSRGTSAPATSPAKHNSELPPPMPSRKPVISSNSEISAPNTVPLAHHAHVHPQPPLHPSQRSESSKSASQQQHSPYNPFVTDKKPTLPSKSDDRGNRLPPLPPRKPPPPIPATSTTSIPPVPPPRHASRNRPERSQSPSRRPNVLVTPSNSAPGNIHASSSKLPLHVTSTLMKQSLQASKVAQSMKRAEEQLEKERVMQVLKSSSTVSGSYSLAGATVTHSSIVVGTNIHNQYPVPVSTSTTVQGISRRSPSPRARRNFHPPPPSSSVSSASTDERAPPLPRRRIHHQSSPSTVSNSSLEQVALAAAPPGYGRTTNSNPPDDYALSPFRSPVEAAMPASMDVLDPSPSRRSLGDRPSAPPPTHPDRKPHLPYQSPTSTTFPRSREENLQAFDAVYGTSSTSPLASPTSTPPLGRVFRSKSMHQQSPPLPPLQPPPVRRRRPESVQVLGNGEVLVGSLTRREDSPSAAPVRSPLSRNATISTPIHHRRSSLSVSSTPFSDDAAVDKPLSNIQRTIANLQPKLEGLNIHPHLDKARYKAEAGFSKRGFVRDPGRHKTGVEGEEEEGLMEDGKGRASSVGRMRWGMPGGPEKDVFDDPEVDDDSVDDWTRSRGSRDVFGEAGEVRSVSPLEIGETDNLKWPAGEGWKPL